MEKTVQNSRKSASCDGFIRAERTIVISLNDPILPGPLIDGGLRQCPFVSANALAVMTVQPTARAVAVSHFPKCRFIAAPFCQSQSNLCRKNATALMGRGIMSPYGHIIAKPETWVNILSEISPGKLCKVSESVPPSLRKKHPASPMRSFPLAMRKQAW